MSEESKSGLNPGKNMPSATELTDSELEGVVGGGKATPPVKTEPTTEYLEITLTDLTISS